MRFLKSKFRSLWYIGLGAALALVPAIVAFADDGSDEE